MSLAEPTCPTCSAPLTLTHSGELDTWVCPQHHGVAMTMSEGYRHLQDDELESLWELARSATPTAQARLSPLTGRPMVSVILPYDSDEVPGAPAPQGTVTLDVDADEQLIWFDAGEFEALPTDLPNAEPTPEELAEVESIRARYGEAIVTDSHDRTSHELAERIQRRLPRLFRADRFSS